MCGIIGAVAQRDVVPILLEGLRRLEYRGYDSAGIAVLDADQFMQRCRSVGKVNDLIQSIATAPISGFTGIGHTRWATHGKPSEDNAHPLMSGEHLAIVHNGIIENHADKREFLLKAGYHFHSETDTEVVAHLIDYYQRQAKDLLSAVQQAVKELEGAFALGIISLNDPGRLLAVRKGSPLVIGIGIGEHFIASDHLALLPVTQQLIYLEEGDIADLSIDSFKIWNKQGQAVQRAVHTSRLSQEGIERGEYRHFMLKEIFEQPVAISNTLQGRVGNNVFTEIFGERAPELFAQIRAIQIAACGTSYYAGMVGKYWLEELAGIPTKVDIASEFRYQRQLVQPGTLFITLSQSGETADTLAALRVAKAAGYTACLAICNVPESSLVRNSDLTFLTGAGPEIGVASTKAFTTQLTALLLLAIVFGRLNGLATETRESVIQRLHELPKRIEQVLTLETQVKQLATFFTHKHHAIYIGRGMLYPIALEGALKLKEISYIHAEAYPAGELKHGPLALIDQHMPVVALAPNDKLLDKIKSNLEEIRARGGELFVFTDGKAEFSKGIHTISLPAVDNILAPILYAIPLQLLAYHIAVLKGTDIDQPRNLAKSVTVE